MRAATSSFVIRHSFIGQGEPIDGLAEFLGAVFESGQQWRVASGRKFFGVRGNAGVVLASRGFV
jgi:hypothetical protein